MSRSCRDAQESVGVFGHERTAEILSIDIDQASKLDTREYWAGIVEYHKMVCFSLCSWSLRYRATKGRVHRDHAYYFQVNLMSNGKMTYSEDQNLEIRVSNSSGTIARFRSGLTENFRRIRLFLCFFGRHLLPLLLFWGGVFRVDEIRRFETTQERKKRKTEENRRRERLERNRQQRAAQYDQY